MRQLLLIVFLLTGFSALSYANLRYGNGYSSGYNGSNGYGGNGYGGAYGRPANIKVDSLRTLLATTLANKDNPTDTLTINRINKLAAEFIDVNPDSTLYYGKMAIDRSLAIKYKKGIADGLMATAKVYTLTGRYDKAQKNFIRAKLLYIDLKDEKSLSNCYIEYGRMFNRIAKYEEATGLFKQALEIKKHIRDEIGIAECYHNMGMVSDNIGKSPYALDNYFKSLSLDIKLNDDLKAASNYNNIGVVMQEMQIYPKSMEYFKRAIKIWQDAKNIQGISTAYENIGEILMAEKKYDEALVYLNKSLKLTKSQDDKDGLSSLYSDFGLCYASKKDYPTSLKYLEMALNTAITYNLDFNRAYAYLSFATVYNQQKDYQNAYKYAMLAKKVSSKLGGLTNRTSAALQLSEALGGLKRFEEAYNAQKDYDALRDSLKSDESVQKLTSFNLESGFKEKQRQIAEQHARMDEQYQQKIQRQGLLSIIFFIIILGMVGIIIVYYRSRRKQQRINFILEEKNHQVVQQKANLNEQADKLNELNNLKDRLISVLAHDLRAPLSTLRGLFGLLEDDSITHEQFLTMIPQAVKKLEYTSDFLDTLLFWINSQMENFNGSSKTFTLKEVATCEIHNYYEQALEKGIKLVDKVPTSLAVSADPNSIRIVIRNLITNAIKFSKQNDTITVTANQYDDHILLSIKDTGVGMTEKQMNKLFKSKVDSGTGTNNEVGTGMGLLFCKDLIEKCNGKIWVQSEQGNGTEFFFTLPLGAIKEEEPAMVA